MLASSSHLGHRARCAHPARLGTVGISSAVVARQQYVRGFRFGRPWSSYLDNEAQRDDIYRRYRCFQYKYTEMLNRRAQAGKHPLAEDTKSALKRIVHDYWHPHGKGCRASGRPRDLDDTQRSPDNPDGIRPGHNIEDVERAPMEGLLFGRHNRRQTSHPDDWESTLPRSIRHSRSRDTWASSPEVPRTAPTGTPSNTEPEYTIDPITNRKVLKVVTDTPHSKPDEDVDVPVETFKSYRSQFSSFTPPDVETVPESEPRKPRQPEKPILDAMSLGAVRRPVLENERCVAEVGGASMTPVTDLLGTLSEKHQRVSWHQSDNIATASETPAPQKPRSGPGESQYIRPFTPSLGRENLHTVDQRGAQGHGGEATYGPVRYAESDGEIPNQQTLKEYQGLYNYGSSRSHEVDRSHELDGGASVDPRELKQYGAFRSHEPDGKYAASQPEPGPDAEELSRYSRPFLSHEPDGKYAEGYIEPEAAEAEEAEQPRYDPSRTSEHSGRFVGDSVTSEPMSDGRDEHQALTGGEPGSKDVKEVEPESEASDLGNHEAFGYEDSETNPFRDMKAYDSAKLKENEEITRNEPDRRTPRREDAGVSTNDRKRASPPEDKTHYRKMLELFMARSAAESDTVDGYASSTLKYSKEKLAADVAGQGPGLTGNYARDFPEDFVRSWSTENSESGSSLLPADLSTSDVQSMGAETTTVRPPGALQPALERNGKPKTPAKAHESQTPPEPAREPTLYKILVHDPIMQCINVAETTSIVPENATPLTPSEVLLRLSNPSKFLPHFGPLQTQGFEIVSGAGDVLIFRKVREAASQPGSSVNDVVGIADEPAAAPPITRPAVNPIDMTGGPRDYNVAVGRFASPTGFVNYELPPVRFDSGIDVRREEPVFSGAKEEPKKKASGKSITKRIAIGAVWVAGLSYSLGVIGDYFKTGGSDGKGPKGF